MPNLKPGTIIPTSEEDAKIRAGIAADPDNPELTPEQMKRMRPGVEITPKLIEEYLRRRCNEEPSGASYVNVPIDNDIATSSTRQAPTGTSASTTLCARRSSAPT